MTGYVADGALYQFRFVARKNCVFRSNGRSQTRASERSPGDVEPWQLAALDCQRNAEIAGKNIERSSSSWPGIHLARDRSRRTRPAEHLQPSIRELRRRCSRHQGADAALVAELGLFDNVPDRFAIFGTLKTCCEQRLRAQKAGLERVMFTVTLASDPLAILELFGREVLPALY